MLKLIFILAWGTVYATSLVSRPTILTTSLLPEDIWAFGASHTESLSQSNKIYSDKGTSISNSEYFSRDVSYGDLLDEINDPLERDLAEAAFSVYGKDKHSNAGRVINDISIKQKSDAYILGRGMSKQINFFIIFPVVTIETDFNSRFIPGSSMNQLAAELESEGQSRRSREIMEKSRNALQQRLNENDYRNSYPSRITTLANIHLNLRYQAVNHSKYQLMTDSFLIVPAGNKFDQDDFMPIRINEEQYSLKEGLTASWHPIPAGVFLTHIYYHKRFPFQKRQRIPMNNTSPLSNDTDNTKTQYGDTWGGSIQANYQKSDNLSFYIGQNLEYKLRDSFSGSKYESSRYKYLEEGSDQHLRTTYLGTSLNTIQAFLAKRFIIPMDLNLQYAFTNEGKNAFKNEIVSLNMLVFYK